MHGREHVIFNQINILSRRLRDFKFRRVEREDVIEMLKTDENTRISNRTSNVGLKIPVALYQDMNPRAQ